MSETTTKLAPRARKLAPADIPAGMDASRILSPRRKTTEATTVDELAREQLEHFGIDPKTDYGKALYDTVVNLYQAQANVHELWRITRRTILGMDRTNRIAYFNAKKFLSFQVAKILDTVQNPFRKAYQSLYYSDQTVCAKGPYPIFDNVTALFSANPVIVRTATYIYACTEWVDDAFQGRELLHEIYSRLLNPTSISLANYVVELEAGTYAPAYMAWNFNSGMAAIDTLLGHLLNRGDAVVASRHVYGGTYQLLHDYYALPEKFGVRLEWFDGTGADELAALCDDVEEELEPGNKVVVFLESPCNPHGYVVDVPGICRVAHERGHTVILDSTVATPFLAKPLQRTDRRERPDYLIHSYTKDLTGNGNATAGVVIAENHLMFLPKGDTYAGTSWDQTLFWGVYYVKGAFLDSDKAFEVMSGIKTLELRMMQKCINTIVLAHFLNSHPDIHVCSNVVEGNPNFALREALLTNGLPAPLFTIDMEDAGLPREAFVRFFDCLAPTFNHEVTLGQSNTVILCPAYTSHSEMDADALHDAGIAPTTIRIAVGDEDPKELMAHFIHAAHLALDAAAPGFSKKFMGPEAVDALVRDTYLDVHRKFIEGTTPMAEVMT